MLRNIKELMTKLVFFKQNLSDKIASGVQSYKTFLSLI